MATNTATECSICNEEFDEDTRCPRSLPCSHCICSECIKNLIGRNDRSCPFCRQNFRAQSVRDIGKNTVLLDVLQLLKDMKQKSLVAQNEPETNRNGQADLQELKRQSRKSVSVVIAKYQNAGMQIDAAIQDKTDVHENLLQGLQVIQNEIASKMKAITEKTSQRARYVEELKKRLQSQRGTLESKEKVMEEVMKKLDASDNFTQAGPLIDQVKAMTSEAQNYLQTFTALTEGDKQKYQKIRQVVHDTREKMLIIQDLLDTPVEGEADVDLLPASNLSTTEELDRSMPLNIPSTVGSSPNLITTEALRERGEETTELLRQGKILAVQNVRGRRRFAQMSIHERDRVCLHRLVDQELPSDVHLLEYGDLMKLVYTTSRIAFLELSNKQKEVLGRHYIRLEPDGKRAQQFTLLCSGEAGPSYCGTKVLGIWGQGLDVEQVHFGDYEDLGGKGGRALVPEVCKEDGLRFKLPQVAGIVQGRNPLAKETVAAQFYIYPRDKRNRKLDWCFGNIEEGLDVLHTAIARHPDISDVFISDTGLVLPV